MIDANAIGATVREILSSVGTQANITAVADTESLLGSGVLDSVAMVGLVAGLEARFGIAIDDAELVPEHFDSVAAIVALVSGKLRVR